MLAKQNAARGNQRLRPFPGKICVLPFGNPELDDLRIHQFLKYWASEAGFKNKILVTWSVNLSLLRLLQNPGRERQAQGCRCHVFPINYKFNDHVVTASLAVLSHIGCSSKLIKLFYDMDPANAVVVFEDWLLRTVKLLVKFP